MATDLPSCFSIQFLKQLLKFPVNFTLLKYVKSQRSYGFSITKELIFGFHILDLKYRFSASLRGYQWLTACNWHVTSAPSVRGTTNLPIEMGKLVYLFESPLSKCNKVCSCQTVGDKRETKVV